jgi:hypothetical protein
MERCLRAAAAAAGAGSRLIVGVDDDWLKWTASPDRIVRAYGDLNLGAVRVTLRWQPGEPCSTPVAAPPAPDRERGARDGADRPRRARERRSGAASGVLWADWTRKPSFATFEKAINDVLTQQIDCTRFPASVR